jgi:hypothetical protein
MQATHPRGGALLSSRQQPAAAAAAMHRCSMSIKMPMAHRLISRIEAPVSRQQQRGHARHPQIVQVPAAASAASWPAKQPSDEGRMVKVCKAIAVGLAASFAWSLVASAVAPGAGAPLASLTMAAKGASSAG